MTLNIYLGSIILLIGIASCSPNKSADPDFKYDRIQATQINTSGAAKEIAQITLPATISKAVNNSAAPVVIQQQSPGISASSNSNTNAANITLNPAHGKAGHRCDIAVGAPLNSKPGPILQNQSTIIPQAAKLNSGSTNKSLNPAHGQPGHRCDIAAGAPLNSKPASAGSQNKQTIVNANSTSTEAASRWGASVNGNPVAQNQAGKITTPGMNPSHGEPDHRCDIPVGTSLNQAIVKTNNPIKNTKSSTTIKDSTKN